MRICCVTAVFIGINALIVSASAQAVAQVVTSARRVVLMEIMLPGDDRKLRLGAKEGEMASLVVDGMGSFGFTPKLITSDEKLIEVAIFETTGDKPKLLGKVDVSISQEIVKSKTSPSFGLRVHRVVQLADE